MRTLIRSRDNRIFAGVCGGIAEFFGISSTLVRVLFVVCGMVLPYLILAIFLPEY